MRNRHWTDGRTPKKEGVYCKKKSVCAGARSSRAVRDSIRSKGAWGLVRGGMLAESYDVGGEARCAATSGRVHLLFPSFFSRSRTRTHTLTTLVAALLQLESSAFSFLVLHFGALSSLRSKRDVFFAGRRTHVQVTLHGVSRDVVGSQPMVAAGAGITPPRRAAAIFVLFCARRDSFVVLLFFGASCVSVRALAVGGPWRRLLNRSCEKKTVRRRNEVARAGGC